MINKEEEIYIYKFRCDLQNSANLQVLLTEDVSTLYNVYLQTTDIPISAMS